MAKVIMTNGEIPVYEGKFWGNHISEYGLTEGYLDYHTLVKSMTYDCYILNNSIMEETRNKGYEWNLVNGEDYWEDEETGEAEYAEFYQYFIIPDDGFKNFQRFTNEPIYYCDELDIYLLAVGHYGTSWDYVLTDYKIVE